MKTVGEALDWTWKHIILSMPVKVVILSVVTCGATLYVSYEFYAKKQMEKASGASVAEVERIKKRLIAAEADIEKDKEELKEILDKYDDSIKKILVNTKATSTKVDIIYDLVIKRDK